MNRKGQALIEFVLILPVFILLLFAIIDFGHILNNKNELENDSVDIVSMIKNNKSVEEIKEIYPNILIEKEDENDFIKIIISREVNVMTPGLNLILGNPYRVKVERNIPNEA